MPEFRRCLAVVVIAWIVCGDAQAQAQAQATGAISGRVVDSSGAALPSAAILLERAEFPPRETISGGEGRFAFAEVPIGDYLVRVVAPGFAEQRIRIEIAAGANVAMTVALRPASLTDAVTVTASRGAARLESPASTSVLTSAELLNGAPFTVDEALRNTPGFSLFRRSSSRTSTPPTQGVTLRGIAGSGASRTLVLADGQPLNDPFGSWVYWNRIPIVAIERVEVVRGAAGDLYGSDALGGVVQILTFVPGRARVRAALEAASFDTLRASAFGSGQRGSWFGSAAAEWEDTAGAIRIAETDRGPVDTPMASDYRTGFATVGYDHGGWRAHVRAAATTEDRSRGTLLLVDDTSWRQVSGEVSGTGGGGAWLVRAAGGTQEYFNNFSSISSDRTTERPTREQNIPTTSAHASAQYARPWRRHALLFGAEGKRARSTIEEIRFSPSAVRSGPFLSGGTETAVAAFGRVNLSVASSVTVMLSMREDHWESQPFESALPARIVDFVSPSASVSWQAADGVTLRTAAYRSYRTPTLNELHRGFRVGDTVTDGNALLDPERLAGLEAGALLARGAVSTRITGFWTSVNNLIANITIGSTPQLITRQKQNADTARAAGLELEADLRLTPRLTVSALGAFTASHFVATPKQPEIQGKRVPQVPLYQFGAGLTYTAPGAFTLSAQWRALGAQFEDDRNELALGAYTVLDAYASRNIRRGTQLFVAMENVLNAEYDVGRTPLRTIGWPRAVRGGIRMFLP